MSENLESYAHSLARIHWELFGTLTFGHVPNLGKRLGRVWRLMSLAAQFSGRPYSRLLIAVRGELGEMTGRSHKHVLLGGTEVHNRITLAHQLEYAGFGLSGYRGFCKFRPYDDCRAGVAYVTKCLSEGTWGANEYEMRKFNLADTVILSNSIFQVIRSLDRLEREAVARTRRKDGLAMSQALAAQV